MGVATQGGFQFASVSSVSSLAAGPDCPRCGRELLSSKMYPEGISADGTTYVAKTCRSEGLWFGRAVDGSWSVTLNPVSRG